MKTRRSGNSDGVADLFEFREEQRRRCVMSTTDLASRLAAERACHPESLFGERLRRDAVPPERQYGANGFRFPDELAALRAYAAAALALVGCSGTLRHVGFAEDLCVGRKKRSRNGNGARAVRLKPSRVVAEPLSERKMADFVDVGCRLDGLPYERVTLLLDRYVFGVPVTVLAEESGRDGPSIGGTLGQARRELRRALSGLIPSTSFDRKDADPDLMPPRPAVDPIEKRRERAFRFLRKRTGGEDLREVSA